jgi:hypothetical protein
MGAHHRGLVRPLCWASLCISRWMRFLQAGAHQHQGQGFYENQYRY